MAEIWISYITVFEEKQLQLTRTEETPFVLLSMQPNQFEAGITVKTGE